MRSTECALSIVDLCIIVELVTTPPLLLEITSLFPRPGDGTDSSCLLSRGKHRKSPTWVPSTQLSERSFPFTRTFLLLSNTTPCLFFAPNHSPLCPATYLLLPGRHSSLLSLLSLPHLRIATPVSFSPRSLLSSLLNLPLSTFSSQHHPI